MEQDFSFNAVDRIPLGGLAVANQIKGNAA